MDLLRSPIGLDFGARRVRAMQLTRRPGSWRIAAAGAYPRLCPDGPVDMAEARHLLDVLDRQGFRGRQVVTAVPGDALLSGILEVPGGADAPRGQIARSELGRMHSLDPGQLETAWWDLPGGVQARSACQVMVVGYAHSTANALLDVLDQAGLDVTALDVRSCALARACEPALKGPQSIFGLLDIRWNYATLSMVFEDRIVYERRIEAGGLAGLYKAVHRATGLDDDSIACLLDRVDVARADKGQIHGKPVGPQRAMGEIGEIIAGYIEQVSGEVATPISYVDHEYRGGSVDRILLAGQVASIRGMATGLESHLSVPVTQAAARELADCAESLQPTCGPEMTAALGYCLFTE